MDSGGGTRSFVHLVVGKGGTGGSDFLFVVGVRIMRGNGRVRGELTSTRGEGYAEGGYFGGDDGVGSVEVLHAVWAMWAVCGM